MSTVAVVPAAGSGERLAAGAPKAFVNLTGRPMLEYALRGLRDSGVVDHIVVAVPPNRIDQAKLVFGGDAVIVAGGADRTESVRLAGFQTELLRRAYERAGAGGFTDDASMVEMIGAQVQVVEGDPLAFKITTPTDLLLAEALLARAE